MANLEMRIHGVDTTIANLNKFWDENMKKLAVAMDDVVTRVYYTSLFLVPIRTGQLHNSITAEITRRRVWVEGFVVASTRYAAYVELGTSRTPKQAFLWPAVEQHQAYIYEKLGDGVREAIEATAKYERRGPTKYGRL